jgi:hypothetical protein
MKKQIFILLIGMFFLVSFVSSQAVINHSVFYAIQEEDGTFNTTTIPVNGAKVLVYNCIDSACSSVNQTPFYSFNASSGSNQITIVYPTVKTVPAYAFYVYKEGFIGWEQRNITWAGTGSAQGNITYLSKKRTAFAPITNFSVYNQVEPNKPIEINVSVGIDANTASAIRDARETDIPLKEDFEVEVLLRITNSSGDVIHPDSIILNIPYSENATISFVYGGFNSTGIYNVTLITNITDAKILNPLLNNATFQIQVIEQNLTNYSYSLLRGVSHSPLFPIVNDSVNISFDYLSNFVNFTGGLNALNTSLDVIIERNGNFYKNFSFNLPNLSTDFSPSFFDFIVNQTGFYQVHLFANPNPSMGNQSIGTNATISFHVIGDDDGDDDDGNGDNGNGNGDNGNGKSKCFTCIDPLEEESTAISLLNRTIDPTIDLFRDADETRKSSYFWLWVLLLLVAIIIVLIALLRL